MHKQSEDAAQLVKAEGNAAAQLAAVRTPAAVPGLAQQIAAADALVTSSRKRRDQAAQAAAEADEARSGLPDKAGTQRQLDMHALRRDLIAEAEKQARALTASQQNEAALAAQLQAADLAVAEAQGAVEAARRAHAAAGLAETLHVGDDCPVCQQKIEALPAHRPPADVSAAQAALEAATTAQRSARAAHDKAARATASAQSVLDGTRSRLDKAAEVMAAAPPEAELTRQLEAIAAADGAVARTRAAATACQTELAAAEKSREALQADEQRAWAALAAARDKLVALGAPAVAAGTGQDLAAAWATLAGWAAAEGASRTGRLPQLENAAAQLKQQFDSAAVALGQLLAEHDVRPIR